MLDWAMPLTIYGCFALSSGSLRCSRVRQKDYLQSGGERWQLVSCAESQGRG